MTEYFAYKHRSGKVYVRRYFNQADINYYSTGHYTMQVYGPFKADTRAAALEHAQIKMKCKTLRSKSNA